LNLEEPWYVAGASFDEKDLALRIHIGIRKDAAFVCPECGGTTRRFGYEKKERTWRHGDCMFYPVYVHCRRPRVVCPHCGVKQINAPYERKNSRFTLLFEGYAMLIVADMNVAKTAALLRCDEKALTSILRYWVNKAVADMDLKDVAMLAIDETSFKRGHKYVTVVIDAAKRRVIDVEKDRDREAVRRFVETLSAKGGDPQAITHVTSDMSTSYLPAIAKHFPNAVNIIDKFHVKKTMLDALDEVRKAEQKEVSDKKALFQGRRLFMIPEGKMTTEQSAKLAELSKRYPKTGRAYRIIAALDDFYESKTMEEARSALDSLYSWMRRCRLKPMKEAAETLKRHREKILNYFQSRLMNMSLGLNTARRLG